ncbi:MAG: hypothetical protein WBI17_15350 [Clostridiaceae bacterium]
MSKKSYKVMAFFLTISILSNIALMFYMNKIKDISSLNVQKLNYLENNIDESISKAIGDHISEMQKQSSSLEDVNWTLSDILIDNEKMATFTLAFKLKNIDTTSNIYVSFESGTKEAELIKAEPINETTYEISKIISILEPVSLDLIIEKYGDKDIENILDDTYVYKQFIGESSVNVSNFEYGYDQKTGEIESSYKVESNFSGNENITLKSAEIIILKNGIPIEKMPIEKLPNTNNSYQLTYNYEAENYKFNLLNQDIIDFSVVFVDNNNFNYIYSFAKFTGTETDPIFISEETPELVIR